MEIFFLSSKNVVIGKMLQVTESEIGDLSTELFQRIIDYSALEISWYIKNPIKGRLVIGATIESDEEIRSKTIERYGLKGENIYYGLLEGIEKEGFNKAFLEKADIKKESFEQIKEEYIQKLTEKIEHSEMYIYKGLGHAAYDEAKDFYNRVYEFLAK